jgi:putative transposase
MGTASEKRHAGAWAGVGHVTPSGLLQGYRAVTLGEYWGNRGGIGGHDTYFLSRCYRWYMARLARVVIPGLPHHVTQRGNRREAIFFEDGDHEIYLDLLAGQALKAGIAVWAYCLMPNHVHLILKPTQADDLGRAVGETHRRYTNFINARGRWSGHLFQSRFASVVLDDTHLIRAVRYVSMNPVRARLVARPEEWKWSSVRAHLSGIDDVLVTVRPVLDRIPHLKELLQEESEDDFSDLRRAEATGRPLGAPEFVTGLENLLGRKIARRAPGRKTTAKVPVAEQLELL